MNGHSDTENPLENLLMKNVMRLVVAGSIVAIATNILVLSG